MYDGLERHKSMSRQLFVLSLPSEKNPEESQSVNLKKAD